MDVSDRTLAVAEAELDDLFVQWEKADEAGDEEGRYFLESRIFRLLLEIDERKRRGERT